MTPQTVSLGQLVETYFKQQHDLSAIEGQPWRPRYLAARVEQQCLTSALFSLDQGSSPTTFSNDKQLAQFAALSAAEQLPVGLPQHVQSWDWPAVRAFLTSKPELIPCISFYMDSAYAAAP